jgi:hypothetical protein
MGNGITILTGGIARVTHCEYGAKILMDLDGYFLSNR